MPKLKFEYRITAAYLLIGGLWILFSDRVVDSFIEDPDVLTSVQTVKGWIYVLITAILFYIVLKRHLVRLREAEKKAVESDRLKTAFLQNISHEIRTPMNSIVGFSGLLRDTSLADSDKEQYIDMIAKSSDQLLNIVNEVLDISLIETGNITVNNKKVNINEELDDLYLYFKSQLKPNLVLTCSKGCADEKAVITTDIIKVRQVLYNLLSNAFKFTDKGSVSFGYTVKEKMLELYVEDTGIGIDPEFQSTVFERFIKAGKDTTRLYEGVGLGLAICKGNVELLGGKIHMTSVPGEGSKFTFTIPYEPVAGIAVPMEKKIHSGKNLDGYTILVAEDDEVNFAYINEIFKGTGADIIHAANGKEAVDINKQNNSIDLILIDIKMPVMNGYEAIKQIRQTKPNVPIVAQTAYALSDEMLKAFNAGSNDYISKPFKKDQLLNLVSKFLPFRNGS